MPVPAPLPADSTVLGFDVGSRRIGVAIGSAYSVGARALAVVEVRGDGPDWPALDRLQREWRPHGLIVGDPLTLDGDDQPNRKRAQAFARQLLQRYPLPVLLVELEEGVRIVANGIGLPADGLAIGMPLELDFVEVEPGYLLPGFRPARSGG